VSADTSAHIGTITPPAPPEVVAAIVAAITELTRRSVEAVAVEDSGSEWVRASRLAARRAGLQRGSWRLAPRVGPRTGP
jgi:hypothetical protein